MRASGFTSSVLSSERRPCTLEGGVIHQYGLEADAVATFERGGERGRERDLPS